MSCIARIGVFSKTLPGLRNLIAGSSVSGGPVSNRTRSRLTTPLLDERVSASTTATTSSTDTGDQGSVGLSPVSSSSADTGDQGSVGLSPVNSFINRNPRNLEMMGIAWKRKGWRFQYPHRQYYNRLVFEKTNRLISAHVEHSSGVRVLSVSSTDLALARHLYSATDVAAARSVGRVLAYQCLQAGISNVCWQPLYNNPSSIKMKAFCDAMVASGVGLEERDEVEGEYTPGIDYDDVEAVQDLERRQSLVYNLSDESETKLRLRLQRHQTTRRRAWRKPAPLELPHYTLQ